MMIRPLFTILTGLAVLTVSATAKPPKKAAITPQPAPTPSVVTAVKDADAPQSIIRVEVTAQPLGFHHPWSKKAPESRSGMGAVLANGEVLVTGDLIANANYVEFERAETGERMAAEVDVVDYEADLALLKPADPAFLKNLQPLEIGDAKVGDRVDVLQLEATGAQVETAALVTTIAVVPYTTAGTQLLAYRLSSSLQYRDGSFTLPLLHGEKLAGLLMRYDSRAQTIDAIPAPVIRHFLAAAKKQPYVGFPRAGLGFAPFRDPQLRHYAGANDSPASGGVYLTSVEPGGPADQAGIKPGDVLLSIGGNAVDADGNYRDPQYGKQAIQYLISMATSGSSLPVKLLRAGKPVSVTLTVQHRSAADYVVEPYIIDQAPKFYVVGGLVLQELSRQYLKEWGAGWEKKAPEKFVYMDRFQDDVATSGRKKIVFLSQVLPTPLTIGDDQLSGTTVTKINDHPITSLADVPAALEHPINGFHKIEFAESPHLLYLDATQTQAIEPALMRNYGLPAIKSL
ncbi:MAG: PDZ domain-containing protein [Chthoniobacteraceae bacterium]